MMRSKAAADVPLGMMDGAYFTSRKDILDFFNSLLSMNLSKIEETASGAVACQLMDYMFPGSIQMKRVNWEAKSDFQFIENYKLLQAAFMKKNVQKQVDVDRLIRAKYQDNLEFCQWLKAFFEHASFVPRDDYDPVSRRRMGKGGKNLNDIFLPRGMKKNGSRQRGGAGRVSTSSRGSQRPLGNNNRPSTASASSVTTKSYVGASSTTTSSGASEKRSIDSSKVDEELKKKNIELKRRNAEIELTLDNIEKERDFYFDKLRGIEVMLQVHEEKGEESNAEELLQRIYKVLYAKLEDDIVVTDEGELIENVEQLDDDNSVITMDDLANELVD